LLRNNHDLLRQLLGQVWGKLLQLDKTKGTQLMSLGTADGLVL
jgi:hypothetical protein